METWVQFLQCRYVAEEKGTLIALSNTISFCYHVCQVTLNGTDFFTSLYLMCLLLLLWDRRWYRLEKADISYNHHSFKEWSKHRRVVWKVTTTSKTLAESLVAALHQLNFIHVEFINIIIASEGSTKRVWLQSFNFLCPGKGMEINTRFRCTQRKLNPSTTRGHLPCNCSMAW